MNVAPLTTEEAVITFLTDERKGVPQKTKRIEHEIHTLLGVLDMRAYTQAGAEFEWVVGGLYRETVTEMLIEKLKKL